MEAEYWVLSIFAIAVALAAGFIGGRMSAPRQRRVEEMERERDAARDEAEAVRAEVNRHFEESARMFGKLASDYRTFFQQFAETAQNLGLSEGRARELLHQADPSLVARQSGRAERVADEEEASASAAPEAAAETGASGAADEHPADERSPEPDATSTSDRQTGSPGRGTDEAATAEAAPGPKTGADADEDEPRAASSPSQADGDGQSDRRA